MIGLYLCHFVSFKAKNRVANRYGYLLAPVAPQTHPTTGNALSEPLNNSRRYLSHGALNTTPAPVPIDQG